MQKLGKNIFDGLTTAWDGLWIIWITEIFWILLCLPIVTIPAAFAGQYYTMHELVNGETVEWRTFFEGIKLFFWPAVRWTVVNLLVILTLGIYILFLSSSASSSGLDWLSGIPLGLLVIWLIINGFTFPFMLNQENPSYGMALRNSLIFYLKWPFQALAFILINAVVIGLSIWLVIPWIILTASFTALMASVVIKNKLEEVKTG